MFSGVVVDLGELVRVGSAIPLQSVGIREPRELIAVVGERRKAVYSWFEGRGVIGS